MRRHASNFFKTKNSPRKLRNFSTNLLPSLSLFLLGTLTASIKANVDAASRWHKNAEKLVFCTMIDRTNEGRFMLVGSAEIPGTKVYTLSPTPAGVCLSGEYRYMAVDEDSWKHQADVEGTRQLSEVPLEEFPRYFDVTDYEDSGVVARTIVYRLVVKEGKPHVYITQVKTQKLSGKITIQEIDYPGKE